MSLGFSDEYNGAALDGQTFVQSWGAFSTLGRDFTKELRENIGSEIVLREGIDNVSIIYLKAILFLLGYHQVDEGTSENDFDSFTGDSIEKFRTFYNSSFKTIEVNRNLDKELIDAFSDVFSVTDMNAVAAMKDAIAKSNPYSKTDQGTKGDEIETVASKTADPSLERMLPPYKTGSVMFHMPDPANYNLPAPSGKYKEKLVYGDNFPDKDDLHLAKQSIIYSKYYDGDKKVSANFTVKNFACPTTDIILINPYLVEILERLRAYFNNNPISIYSGYRSPAYNESLRRKRGKNSGVAINSMHKFGLAADFKIKDVLASKTFKYLDPWWKGGLGQYPSFIHVDVRDRVGLKRSRWKNMSFGKKK